MQFVYTKKLEKDNTFEVGESKFQVVEAAEAVSKAGNSMLRIKLKLTDLNGSSKYCYDYLLDSFVWKIEAFCICIGSSELLKKDSIETYEILNKTGKCKTRWEQYEGNDHPKVERYLAPKEEKAPEKLPADQEPELEDDDIPF